MNSFNNSFISYGRADSKTFATKLYQRLVEAGLEIWFDQNDIPLGVDFQNQIDDGIEKADNFLFIIAPHSINSPYCGKEIDLAIRRNKRIIPLLHVEQITQEIWQERYPGRDASAWEEYKAKGLHSSFPNMHPAIGKINWVYFREGIDDFEKSFAGLLELCSRHQDYVHQHTYFLAKALEWERQQKNSQYLLIGDERVQAENWLKIRFKHEQPPCQPTDLHCAFICQSTKNANNLMTQVFLSYSEKEREVMEKIANILMRESFTVWTNKTDIQSGADFIESIYRGIEEADNVVFLMSPASLQSEYCQMELSYACSQKKRIIPLLIEQVEVEQIPVELRTLQFIDLTEQQQQEKDANIDKLINVLTQDAAYYEQHKILLIKALKWERQKRNSSILLRGYNLRQAEAWLKIAQQKTQHQPIPLQVEFITESLNQPPLVALDVFISYSRADSDFARKLNDTLQIQNKTTWFDQESIASGTDFEQEIYKGIESTNNFLFIISPDSISSPDCQVEVEYAAKLNKRIVTVLYREVNFGDLSPELAKVKWIDFCQHGGDFLTKFGELTRTLDADPDYVRSHTRLFLKAKEWDDTKHDDSFLLRGKDLVASEEWLKQSDNKEPVPTNLQLEYLAASRALPYRKIKLRTVLLTSLAVTTVTFIARFIGFTQPLELAAYDQMMLLRPDEPKDERFLMVDVDPESLEKLNETGRYPGGRGSIPDAALDDLLKNLSQHQPSIIGLDFIRDFSAEGGLKQRLQQTKNFIAVCKNSYQNNLGENILGFKQPPEIPVAQVGFSDLVDDDAKGGRYVRRQYLMQKPDPKYCQTPDAFSLVIARRYLEAQGQAFTSPLNPQISKYDQPMKFGTTEIPQLLGLGGGYQDINNQLQGYQTMLKYRTFGSDPSNFAPRVNILDVLDNKVSADQISNRIVLIGFTDRQNRQADYWSTPYGDVAGVTLHGQMISQILSATLDNRSLIWWWSLGYETIWMFGWALVGGFVCWQFNRTLYTSIAVISFAGSLYIICSVILITQSGWIPFVPAFMVFLLTGTIVLYLTNKLRKG
ncbi:MULTISPECIES: TIR domain-containing protein [unclassified Anabaena]|uniref:Transmembrane sensor-like protein n=1 Tax=Anabaena sp. XSPORK2A TaxID=1771346 RepID=A0A0U3CCC0_9NOST|nr:MULTISPECIES: TIR domain-containing protein [unclassified Anabaena]ALT22131.1 transmembrane sensor-like protein [Anabaena sp. XSPORK2A]MTJ08944.1 TIR domain-containing protein [Anabaena sp. UHCC 0204]MTJ51856.1 TIR domain-containing protein [Anabaena sp. UHCC 0253]